MLTLKTGPKLADRQADRQSGSGIDAAMTLASLYGERTFHQESMALEFASPKLVPR
jgi:hypothetical protein